MMRDLGTATLRPASIMRLDSAAQQCVAEGSAYFLNYFYQLVRLVVNVNPEALPVE